MKVMKYLLGMKAFVASFAEDEALDLRLSKRMELVNQCSKIVYRNVSLIFYLLELILAKVFIF